MCRTVILAHDGLRQVAPKMAWRGVLGGFLVKSLVGN
jgi:hypothetical protein